MTHVNQLIIYTYSGKYTFSNFVVKSRPSVGPASAAPCQPSPTAYSSAARGTLLLHVFRTHRAHGHLQHSPVARCRAARPTPGFSARRSIPCKNHRPPLFAPLPSAPFAVRSRGLRHATFVRILDHCVCGRPQLRPVARCQTAGPTLGFSAFLSIACMNNRAPLVAPLPSAPFAVRGHGLRHVVSVRVQHPTDVRVSSTAPCITLRDRFTNLQFFGPSIDVMQESPPATLYPLPACAFCRTRPRRMG